MAIADSEIDWQSQAECRGPHATVFFPPVLSESRDVKRAREAAAKAICAGCAVRDACLRHALDVGEQHGIWGGLSASERRVLVRD